MPAGMHHHGASVVPGAAAVAGDAATAPDTVPEHGSQRSPSHSKACICLGACVGAVAIHLPSGPEVLRARIAIDAVAILAPLRERRVATRADVRLPLATAPPAPSPN
jgi:hypothetical protein